MKSIALCTLGQKIEIVRIRDQSPGFLHFIDRRALAPGATATITGKDMDAEAIELHISGQRRVTIGLAAAEKILARDL